MVGFIDIAIAGGVENMSIVPIGGNKPVPDPELIRSYPASYILMGLTAENVARKYSISREEQDTFAVGSHQKAAKAMKDHKFVKQILPMTVIDSKFNNGNILKKESIFDTDECVLTCPP